MSMSSLLHPDELNLEDDVLREDTQCPTKVRTRENSEESFGAPVFGRRTTETA